MTAVKFPRDGVTDQSACESTGGSEGLTAGTNKTLQEPEKSGDASGDWESEQEEKKNVAPEISRRRIVREMSMGLLSSIHPKVRPNILPRNSDAD